MAVHRLIFKNREEWLANRKKIGGSDASSILGLNPYKSNVDLFDIKTGRAEQEDISEKPYVKYGTEAEEHLRKLFSLDYPQYKVEYFEDNMWINDNFPFCHASLDGELTDRNGRKGILEIKTTEIMGAVQRNKWENGIPDNYYCQILHYLLVTEFDFAVLKAQLKYRKENDVLLVTKHYLIERSEVEEDIKYLAEKEKEFWGYVERNERPSLILPEI